MKSRSVRFKVNAAIVVSAFLTALVCNLIWYPFQLRDQKSQWEGIHLLLQSVMEQKQEALANEIFAGQARALAASIRDIRKIDGIVGVQFYDPSGAEILLDPEIGLPQAAPGANPVEIPERPVFRKETLAGKSFAVYWTPIQALGQRVAYARVIYDLSAFTRRQMGNVFLALTVSLAIIGVLVLVLNPLLFRLVVNPVIALREAMRRVQNGDLGRQVAVRSSDEVGQVMAAFNAMSSALEQQQQALADWSANLEQVVKERTRSLQTLSEQLRAENQERREIQQAMEQSEAKLRGIVRVAPVGIGLISHGTITQVNESLCRLLGLDEPNLLGRNPADFFADPAEAQAVLAGTDRQDSADGAPVVTLKSHDGTPVSALFCATPLDPAKPEEAKAFIAMDVTERKRSEQALRESEKRLRAVFNNAGIGIMVTDRHGRYLQANVAAASMLGYSPAFLLELDEDSVILPQDAESAGRQRAEIAAGGQDLWRFERRYRHRDGSTVWGDVTATALRDAQGEVREVIQTVLDVTAKKRLEQEMIRTEKLESIANLAGGIAHDFNNVLTAIMGNIGLVRMVLDQREKVLSRLEAAEKACSRAQELARRLLTFARGGAPIKRVCSIAAIVRDAAALALTGSKVAGRYELPEDLWPIEADQDQLRQALNNIVINAVQAMPEGGALRVSAANCIVDAAAALPLEAGRYVRVSIADQGPGIEAAKLTRIFDPFFSTKTNGSGLGLATAHSIVRRHRGHVSVESEPGVGTTFHLYLPAFTARRSAPASADTTRAPVAGRKVLVMDDEAIIREISSEILRHLGYRVSTATDGREAIRLYREALEQGRPFAAVIMDLTIPGGMGGKEAISEIRRLDPNARAVVSSGYSNDPVMAEYRAYGFDAVAVKPYKIAELQQVLDNLLGTAPD